MSTIHVETKILGRRMPSLPALTIPFPDEWLIGWEQITLNDLISRIVLEEVAAFRKRQSELRLFKVLTTSEIEQAASKGKVSMGGQDLDQAVDEQAAVETALQAFQDGFYLVFVNGQQVPTLDSIVLMSEETQITFVRLIPLAGG
ncbi:MAG: hypothetical protein JXA42_24130 [Anaerolineales bacterium]|nr:hypothetical protein [Anaerolineales bacterium]